MKKMIFTAMAVLAFSAVSMANTIEVKEEVVVNNESKVENTLNQDEQTATPCEDRAIDIYESIIGDGPDNITLLNNLLSLCSL
ncbi:hypothetical protein [Flavobacterium sp. TSSA_36]|uniref:hypothetical protein n=1 Tax=Flavobacterium sp. TSSA_36 TaxID=3447669 RepID=UPI003F37955C